jgi:hypothetical protein
MPIMKTKMLAYSIYILFSLSGLVWAENSVEIPIEFTNRNFLTNIRWTDTNLIQKVISNWDMYSEKQGIEGKEILRKKGIKIYDVMFLVEARKFTSDNVFEFVFNTENGFSQDFREQFMSYAVKTWGQPSTHIDYSWGGKVDAFVSHEVDWFIKDTHIRFDFSGAVLDGHWFPGFCLFFITQKGKYDPLKELIALKCEGKSQLFGFPDRREITPVNAFIVFVDLKNKQLLRRDRSPLGKITEATDEHFISEWTDKTKDQKHRFFIDRKLGTYEWKTTPSESGKNYGAVNWGNCEKTDPQLQQKF